MEVAEGLLYSPSHEWVKREGQRVLIGITDFAQEELGMIVFVELPEIGQMLKAGEPFASLESVKTVTELCSPISGRVVDVNQGLLKDAGPIHLAPYGSGWMIALDVTGSDTLETELAGLWHAGRYASTYQYEG